MAPIFAIIRYALLETFFCIPILPKTKGRVFYASVCLVHLIDESERFHS